MNSIAKIQEKLREKERTANVLTASLKGDTLQVLGVEYKLSDLTALNTLPEIQALAADGTGHDLEVSISFDGVQLFDNEQEGTFTGDVDFILYKGNHYHLTVNTDWGDTLYVNTQDQWDLGDHVAITVPPTTQQTYQRKPEWTISNKSSQRTCNQMARFGRRLRILHQSARRTEILHRQYTKRPQRRKDERGQTL